MRTLILALAFCALAAPAHADRFALEYDGLALGLVPLGEIAVDAHVGEETYRVTARIRSNGLMNLFERTDLNALATGQIGPGGSVHWRRYELDHHYSRKHRSINMRLSNDGAVSTEIVPNYRLWGDPPTSEEQRRASRDPLSTMVAMAVDVGQTRRCAGYYPAFDGRFHYVMELSGGETDGYRGGGYEGPVLKCRLAYIAVAGFEQSDRGRRRVPQGSVWFALAEDSAFAPPVRISTPLSAGGAVIRLTSWRRAEVNVTSLAAE
jgi:hypothetical protein